MPFAIRVKQVTGGDDLTINTTPEATIEELRQSVAEAIGTQADAPAIKIIYKGQILKMEQTVQSYGIQAGHVLHMVKQRTPGSASRPSGTGAASATGASGPAVGTPSAATADPLAQAMGGLGFGGAGGAGSQAEMMQQMMQSPMAQAMLSNPELLRGMMTANPQVRQMMEANPEIARMLNDPDTLRQMSQVMSNPALMREQVRNMDRAMSNIESMPGGFNALAQFHSSMQPLEEAADEAQGAAAAAADNPFAALFQQGGGGGGGGGAAGGDGVQQPAGAPNEAPLPNPWAAGGDGGGGGGGGGGGAGLGGLAGMGGMGGMDPAAMQQMMNSPEMQAAAQQMMSSPAMQQMVQQHMATPQGRQQLQAVLEQNPMYRSAVAADPRLADQMADQMREMMSNPERLQAMLNPRTQQAMQQMMQAMQELQGTGLLPPGMAASMGAMPGGGNAGGAPGGGLPDMSALMAMLGGGGGGGGGMAPAPPDDPGTAYASQLQQLQEMGFYDRDANIRHLLATGGNVNAAVERLLSSI